MGFRVIADFRDAADGLFQYRTGDKYPREGMKVGAGRLAELAGNENRAGYPLIEAEPEKQKAPRRKKTD